MRSRNGEGDALGPAHRITRIAILDTHTTQTLPKINSTALYAAHSGCSTCVRCMITREDMLQFATLGLCTAAGAWTDHAVQHCGGQGWALAAAALRLQQRPRLAKVATRARMVQLHQRALHAMQMDSGRLIRVRHGTRARSIRAGSTRTSPSLLAAPGSDERERWDETRRSCQRTAEISRE